MYHDQGLPVLKALSFGGGVNVTLGLPFVRTSVDHGTALDLAADAGRAKTADPGSLVAALELALRARLGALTRAGGPMEGHTARKRFGQNFLADPHYIAKIVAAVDPQPGDNLVEIGPGLAALTGPLIERAGRISAIEIDRDLAARPRGSASRRTGWRCTSPTRCDSTSRRWDRRCASSATCRTTSARRCCSASRVTTRRSSTCT